MPQLNLFGWLTVCLALALVCGAVAKKLKQSPVLGYLIAGIFLGQLASRFTFPESFINTLSEIGLTFLMFTLGLELSFSRLSKVKNIVLWGSIIQILSVILFALLIFQGLGFGFNNSLFIAAGFALSSTAVVIKILADKNETNSLHGQLIFGWLLIQDLAVLPMVIIIPAITGGGSLENMLISFTKAIVLLVLVLFIGNQLAHRIIAKIADLGARELLLGAVAVICLLTAFLTNSVGLSFSLGAFLAGLILSKTNENHAIVVEIRPLRDFFSIIFFTSLGMMLRPEYLLSHIGLVIFVTLLIALLKIVIVGSLVSFLGYHLKTVVNVGLSLFQVGEFAIILAGVGMASRLIDDSTYSLVLSVTMLSIFLTPGLMRSRERAYVNLKSMLKRFLPGIYNRQLVDIAKQTKELDIKDHIVICGYGRVGSWLGKVLLSIGQPFVVVDFNNRVVRRLLDEGITAVYGDPADLEILDYAQVDKAKIVVVAIPDQSTQESVVSNCFCLNSRVTILSRAHHKEDEQRLKALGVQEIILPEYEASLSVIRRVLEFLALPHADIAREIKDIQLQQNA